MTDHTVVAFTSMASTS